MPIDLLKNNGYNLRNKKRKNPPPPLDYSDDEQSINIVFKLKKSDSESEFVESTETESSEYSEYTDSNESIEELETICESDIESISSNPEFDNDDLIKDITSYISKLEVKYKDHPYIDRLVELSQHSLQKMKKLSIQNKSKNSELFSQLLKEHTTSDEIYYFKKLPEQKQIEIISKLKDIYDSNPLIDQPYRIKIIDSNIPLEYKAIALKKSKNLLNIRPGDGEYYKLKSWLDTFLLIPFNTYYNLPVHISDGPSVCSEFMYNAKKILDDTIYGMNDAKIQIMQFIGQLISNPSSIGSSISIKGPMGTGKTTLIKNGISKILNRPFELIALGGATDSSFLEGNAMVYEGSYWGKIVDILIKSKCMNPIIYFDELDKVSQTSKGEEIIGILTHLTDTTQNDKFHDKFFTDIQFDLSKCLFMFSYNDETLVNPILKDRMYTITTNGYTTKDKIIIATNYLIPSICNNIGININDIIIPPESIQFIIENYKEEKGVRNLKRYLETIYSKINLYRLLPPEVNLFDEEKTLSIQFPMTITPTIVRKLIKTESHQPNSMYI